MKQLLRTLCTACLIAVSAVTAFADDTSTSTDTGTDSSTPSTDYYLRFKTPDYNQCQNSMESLRDCFLFTQIDDDENGNAQYQLAVEHICSNFWIGSKSDNSLYFGTSEVQKISASDVSEDGSGASFSLINSNSSNAIQSDDFRYWKWLQHLLLTLTIDKNDANKATLKVEHITNAKLKKGVPSFMFVKNPLAYKELGNDGYEQAYFRLVRGSGVDDYNVKIGTISNFSPSIVDGPLHSPYLTCQKFLPRADGTSVTLGELYGERAVVDTQNGTDKVANHTLQKSERIVTQSNGKYTIPMHVYQQAGAKNFTAFTLYETNVTFKYDISECEKYKDRDAFNEIGIPFFDNYSETDIDDAQKNLLSHYVNTPEYDSKLTSSYNSDTSKNYYYNGILTIDFELTSTEKFAISLASDGYDKSKAQTMIYKGMYYDEATKTYYVEYYYVYDDLDTAFYIEGFDGESLADSENVTEYAGLSTANSDQVVEKWKYKVGDTETTSAIMGFSESGVQNTAVVSSTITTTDKEYTMPYYVICKTTTKITFRYNISDPSKSIVIADMANSSDDSSNWTGEASILSSEPTAPVEYYNLNGVRVDGSLPGLYIRRQGSNVSKVIIR